MNYNYRKVVSPEEIKLLDKQAFPLIAPCKCGRFLIKFRAYRCYYCGIYYCFNCAAKHFGGTIEEWINDKEV